MKPASAQYHIGSTVHGQPIRLVWSREHNGTGNWTLCKDAADQRDDSVAIFGLTDKNLLSIVEAVQDKVERGL